MPGRAGIRDCARANILGEILGYGNFSDAYDFTAPAEDKIARVQTIRHALEQAGISACDLDYINTHGTSTPLNDLNETEAIKMALGEAAYAIPCSSTKSLQRASDRRRRQF